VASVSYQTRLINLIDQQLISDNNQQTSNQKAIMKLVFSSAFFAAAATSASATCAGRGNRAASNIMGDSGCFPDPTGGASTSDDDYCNDPDRAATICETFISIKYDDWCYGGFPSLSSLQDQCWESVQLLEVQPGKQQKHCSDPSFIFPSLLCSHHLSFLAVQFGRMMKRRRMLKTWRKLPTLLSS